MAWTDLNPALPRVAVPTNKQAAFSALEPNLQVADGAYIALIRLDAKWAGPNNLLIEMTKSYPNATLIRHTTYNNGVAKEYDAIKFAEPSASKFMEDFMEWKAEKKQSRQR